MTEHEASVPAADGEDAGHGCCGGARADAGKTAATRSAA